MKPQVPQALVDAADKETLVDAIYFVVRVLRNVSRGYQDVAVSTDATPETRTLAAQAISEIEAQERRPILNLDEQRAQGYITALESLLRTVYLEAVGRRTEDAEIILGEMRSGSS